MTEVWVFDLLTACRLKRREDIVKFLVVLVAFFCFAEVLAATATISAVMGLSAADSLDNITSRKKKGWISSFFSDNDFELEEVLVVTKSNMNNSGAMTAHMVIVYDHELMQRLSNMTSHEYFKTVNQLIKDFPDKMKIYSWELTAENRIRRWQKIDTLKGTMTPLGGFIFADYHDNVGVHRARIPNYEKVQITFGHSDFVIDYEDKELDNGKIHDITEYKKFGDDDGGWF